jgi:small subunit ribosomal protein S8
MFTNDIIGDTLTRIRNGYRAKLIAVEVFASNQVVALLSVLKEEGYIANFARHNVKPGVDMITVELQYTANGRPSIHTITRVSKPSRRIYTSIKDLNGAYNHLGIYVLSTPKGVLSDRQARKLHVGGEILCKVF